MHDAIGLFCGISQRVIFRAGGETHFAKPQRMSRRLITCQSFLDVIPGNVPQQHPVGNENAACPDSPDLEVFVFQRGPQFQSGARNIAGGEPGTGGNPDGLAVHEEGAYNTDLAVGDVSLGLEGGTESDRFAPDIARHESAFSAGDAAAGLAECGAAAGLAKGGAAGVFVLAPGKDAGPVHPGIAFANEPGQVVVLLGKGETHFHNVYHS